MSANTPPDWSNIPVYQDFFEHHDQYERFHIHVVGLTSSSAGGSKEGGALKARKNWFGRPRVIDAIADPYLTVTTVGQDTGSTDYFPIGRYKFPVLKNCQTPVWDAKCVLLAKKEGTDALEFQFLDHNGARDDTELFTLKLDRSELPATTSLEDSTWTRFTKVPDHPDYADVSLEFHIMVTDGADQIVTQQDYSSIYEVDGYSYTEHVVPDETTNTDEDNALLQCWQSPSNNKAVLWILGRNDCFMHPHVARRLFLERGYDVYVLNYKLNGHCRKQGWVVDPHFNSHNKKGTFDVYLQDISKSLDIIGQVQPYETLLGYAHSTGGPVLLNYLMEHGDTQFDAFLFNSPFLDWGFVGGDLCEFVLEHTGMLANLGAMENDTKVGAAATPTDLVATPLLYCDTEIVVSDWSARLWSLYPFEWGTRPLYKVPMTVGFARGVTGVHSKLEKWHAQHRVVTAKPFLCITSRGDDVLKAPETLSRADWIGPGRWEIELNDNGHDVFLSYDKADTEMALELCVAWMKNRRL